jgi:hypothetical protein
MLTGLLPEAHHAIEEQSGIDAAAPSIAVALSNAGYATRAAVSSIFVSQKYGFERGFDDFEDFGIVDGTLKSQLDLTAERILDDSTRWATQQDSDVAQFHFIHLYDVHYPYKAPAPYDEQFDSAAEPDELQYENYFHYLREPLDATQMQRQINQYDEEIAYTDAQLRAFCERWTAARPNSIFIFVSDHGEEFGERGSWGHAHTLYPEQLHVVWIASGAGIVAQVAPERVGLEDLASSLASLAGIDYAEVDGVDRSGRLLRGVAEHASHRAASIASSSRFRTNVLRWHRAPYDFIANLSGPSYELYDLERDPNAEYNILAESNQLALDMNTELFDALGQPWVALLSGQLETDGVIIVDGVRQASPLRLGAGRRFAVIPADAVLKYTTDSGAESGPWQLVGGSLPQPNDPALVFEGERVEVMPADLTPEQEERLRSLGYIR